MAGKIIFKTKATYRGITMLMRLFIALTLITTVTAFSQGTVNFSNRNIPYTDSSGNLIRQLSKIGYGESCCGMSLPATNIDGSVTFSVGSFNYGVNARAALYGGPVGVSAEDMTLLSPVVGFLSGSSAGFLNVSAGSIATSIIMAPGTHAWVQLRAWDTGDAAVTYEEAIHKPQPFFIGSSEILQVTLGPDASNAPYLVDERTSVPLQPFILTYVPEPSVIGLGLIGVIAGLFVFRCRKTNR